MNKKLYSILFFVPLIVSLLAMTVVTGCSDDDEPLQSTYGYVQFKLLKSASMDKGTTTRAVTDKLDKLSDAQKGKVALDQILKRHPEQWFNYYSDFVTGFIQCRKCRIRIA